MNDEWLVVGSAPSVIENMGRVPPELTVITCNSGIELYPEPDFYLIYDQKSSRIYADYALRAQASGTTLITIHRTNLIFQKENRLDFYDIYLDMDDATKQPTRETWGKPAWSGQMATEYACRSGAKVIHLIGMDGYSKPNDYFPSKEIHPELRDPSFPVQMTENLIRPRMQSLAEVFPDIQFIQYGSPNYEVQSDNWMVTP